jgi:hypothetical protein
MPRDGGLTFYSAAIAQRNHKVSIDSRIGIDLPRQDRAPANSFRGGVHVARDDAMKK